MGAIGRAEGEGGGHPDGWMSGRLDGQGVALVGCLGPAGTA